MCPPLEVRYLWLPSEDPINTLCPINRARCRACSRRTTIQCRPHASITGNAPRQCRWHSVGTYRVVQNQQRRRSGHRSNQHRTNGGSCKPAHDRKPGPFIRQQTQRLMTDEGSQTRSHDRPFVDSTDVVARITSNDWCHWQLAASAPDNHTGGQAASGTRLQPKAHHFK